MNERPSLDEIGRRNATDKSSLHHNYLVFYERFFRELRLQPGLTLLEIGVLDGASARMWEEYFEDCDVIGVDVDRSKIKHQAGRIKIEIADQSDVDALVRIGTTYGPFDIAIDDGSHLWDHQITSFRYLFPFVKPGGYYVIEDLDTSYGSYVERFKGIRNSSTAEYLKQFADYLVADGVVDIRLETDPFIRSFARRTEFIALYRRTAVLRRKPE